jgi:SAM-dependent methyltransferase
MNEAYEYVGSELELFRSAVNWKQTLRRHIQPFLKGRVLEVGAGIGGTTKVFRTGKEMSWTCLEPDVSLAAELRKNEPEVEVITGIVNDLPNDRMFDSILYIDVIEHIEDDLAEIRSAGSHLAVGGHLIVLCPAHQSLYSPFDKAVGHYRRYSKSMFRALRPDSLSEQRMIYLDSVGLFASIANKLVLSQSIPTSGQIAFWDDWLVRASRVSDWFLRYSVGKSVLGVWRKT